MLHQHRLWLIDFQGARLGPPQYDLASLLLDPYVNLPLTIQEGLVTAIFPSCRNTRKLIRWLGGSNTIMWLCVGICKSWGLMVS